jgi:hypothetical protein
MGGTTFLQIAELPGHRQYMRHKTLVPEIAQYLHWNRYCQVSKFEAAAAAASQAAVVGYHLQGYVLLESRFSNCQRRVQSRRHRFTVS